MPPGFVPAQFGFAAVPPHTLTSQGPHSEHVLGQIGKDEVRRDRRDLVEAGLAELALDVVFLREAEPAMRLDAGLGRSPGGFGGQHLGHVSLLAGRLTRLEQAAALAHHQLGRTHLRVGARNRELDALVLADRTAEHDAVLRILD
jgi:hypothetical protein